mmetsp:Transcript_21536/g.69522  ORF Transcript_21536/g.69522 Transcript_21536/m.69522 type:complete len:479 (+) Transcript_21536:807-2243(+)
MVGRLLPGADPRVPCGGRRAGGPGPGSDRLRRDWRGGCGFDRPGHLCRLGRRGQARHGTRGADADAGDAGAGRQGPDGASAARRRGRRPPDRPARWLRRGRPELPGVREVLGAHLASGPVCAQGDGGGQGDAAGSAAQRGRQHRRRHRRHVHAWGSGAAGGHAVPSRSRRGAHPGWWTPASGFAGAVLRADRGADSGHRRAVVHPAAARGGFRPGHHHHPLRHRRPAGRHRQPVRLCAGRQRLRPAPARAGRWQAHRVGHAVAQRLRHHLHVPVPPDGRAEAFWLRQVRGGGGAAGPVCHQGGGRGLARLAARRQHVCADRHPATAVLPAVRRGIHVCAGHPSPVPRLHVGRQAGGGGGSTLSPRRAQAQGGGQESLETRPRAAVGGASGQARRRPHTSSAGGSGRQFLFLRGGSSRGRPTGDRGMAGAGEYSFLARREHSWVVKTADRSMAASSRRWYGSAGGDIFGSGGGCGPPPC